MVSFIDTIRHKKYRQNNKVVNTPNNMIIEIATHGSSIKRRRERFLIRIPDQKDSEISAEKVSAILISANAMISTSAVKLCIERHIQLVITGWSGKPIARMWTSSPGRQTQIRRQQYLNYDTQFAFETIKQILIEKLGRQKRFLSELKRNRKDETIVKNLSEAIIFFNKIIHEVKDSKYNKSFANSFLGFEGSCAVRYFSMLSACLPKKWRFLKRTQNPGLDPFNAALNYMYGIAYSNIEKVVVLSGLDPTAGFYHKDNYGKPTLVFDLIEPCRPIIDKSLVYLFNRRIVREGWFANSASPCTYVELTKEGRSELISTYRENCQKNIEKETWNRCQNLTKSLLELDREVDIK